MGIARETAPEIDRLVLSVWDLGPERSGRLAELARERGLESLDLLPHFADFLLAGVLTSELATLRMRYRRSSKVLARLDELQAMHFIRRDEDGFAASPTSRPLLEGLLAARAERAAELWGGHDEDVATATEVAGRIGHAASVDHMVAVAHRRLPEPADPYHRLGHRLLTLRYIRQHDHAEAWLARGLTAPDMVLMTQLWHTDQTPAPMDVLARVVELGFVEADPLRLTVTGREVREAIETETDERAQQAFNVLDSPAAARFLAALQRLPGTIG